MSHLKYEINSLIQFFCGKLLEVFWREIIWSFLMENETFLWFSKHCGFHCRFQEVFSNLPPFNCSARCQAPDAFFSGAPWLAYPEDGILKILENGNEQKTFLEWQIWTGLRNSSDLVNYELEINGDQVAKNQTLEDQQKYGLDFDISEKWISDKILSVKLHLELSIVSIFASEASFFFLYEIFS